MRCEAEMCANWTGQGCMCEVLDVEPETFCPDCSDGATNIYHFHACPFAAPVSLDDQETPE